MDRVRYGRLAAWIATAGGAGYSPIAPGTCGTLVAVPIAWLSRGWSAPVFAGFVALVTAIAIAAADRADRAWGTHDSQRIVIDEVAGYLATLVLVDRSTWQVLAVAFVVFRALDITKPPPIRWIERRVPGGAGVVLDDVAAGVIGAVLLAFVFR